MTQIPLWRLFASARVGLAAAGLFFAATLGNPSNGVADETDARNLLKSMSDYLAAQQAISFNYDASFEVITKEDQKLSLASSGSVTINRPDKLRATRAGGFADIELIFDGDALTVLGKGVNVYTRIDVPGTIDHLIDQLRDRYGIPLPAADLLTSDANAVMMQDVNDVKDLGSGVIGGVECDFLAFRTDEVDWQIWIAQGDQPYPCRYAIVSKKVANAPQYSVQFRNWKTGGDVAEDDFQFVNTSDAKMIDLEEFAGIEGLPEHFKRGDAK